MYLRKPNRGRVRTRAAIGGTLAVSGLVLLSLVFPARTFADLEFKKQVIESCDVAIKNASSLEPARKDELISDLKLLLKLQTTLIQNPKLPPSALNKLGDFDAPLEELKGTDIWTGFQPTRNIRAKRCAVQIVALLSPNSIETLPEMILLLGDSTLPHDLRLLADETVTALTVRAAQDPSLIISNETFRGLIALLDSPLAYKAENALIELREKTVHYLISEIKKPDASRRDRIVNGLLKIDDSGDLIGRDVLELLSSGDDGLRKRAAQLLSELENIYPQSVPALIERLNDLSSEVEEAALEALAAIFERDRDTPRIVIDEPHLEMLLKAFRRLTPTAREKLIPMLVNVGPLVPDYNARMLALLNSEDPSLRAAVIEALGESPAAKPEAFQAIFAALKDPSLEVKLRAIASLADHAPSAQIIAALESLLKANATSSNPETKQRILLAVAKTVTALRPGTRAKQLVPYLLDALYLSDPGNGVEDSRQEALRSFANPNPNEMHSGVAALVAIGRDSVPLAAKSLQKKDRAFQVRAITLLGLITPPDPRAISALAEFLKESSLSEIASAALSRIGKPAAAEVRKVFQSSSGKAKLTAAKVLLTLGESDKSILSYTAEGIAAEPCHEKAAFALALRIPSDRVPPSLTQSLITCLSSEEVQGDRIVAGLTALAPLPAELHPKLVTLLTTPGLTMKNKLQLLEQSEKLGLTQEELLPTLIDSLKDGDKSLQFRVLNLLKEAGPRASDALPSLLAFLKENEDDPLLANEAVIAIARIDQNAYNYTDYLLRALQGDEYQWAQKSVLKLPRPLAVPLIGRALSELPADKTWRVVEIVSQLGDDAKQFVPNLLNYINAPDANLRYIATLALLRVDPENQVLLAALRRELLGEYRKDLLASNLSASAKPILESIAASSNSYVERKVAMLLLKRMR